MPIRSVSDILAAYDEGRTHVQRFYKGSLVNTADQQWQDWAFAPGQPAYDARIGVAGQFNPFIATRNDAIWFPGIEPGQTRHLSEVVLKSNASSANMTSVDGIVYDLLGVYPLIDGDSTDIQLFDNTLPLPRYADGAGVFPVLVNHVAPVVVNAPGTYTYLDHNGVERSASFGVNPTGPGRVCSCPVSGTFGVGALSLPLVAGSRGARAITSIRFGASPGGLYSLYMYRPLMTTTDLGDGGLTANRGPASVKSSFLHNGWHAPRVFDGAHLGMFLRPAGGWRAISSIFGHFEFIWG